MKTLTLRYRIFSSCVAATISASLLSGCAAAQQADEQDPVVPPTAEVAAPAVEEAPFAEKPAVAPDTSESSAAVPAGDAESAATETQAAVVSDSEANDLTTPPEAAAPAKPAYNRDDVRWIQQRLQELGYYDGAIDGAAGQVTREAIKSYQLDQELEQDGRPTPELREFMWRNGG